MDTHLSAAAAAAAADEHGFSSTLQESAEFKYELNQCQYKLPDLILKYSQGWHT